MNMQYKFYALISRMRYITRWGLMRNTFSENIAEHSHMVAVLAHSLALIRRDILGLEADPERCAAAALYHAASEILTGDLPMCTFVNNDITDGSACMILKNSAGNPFCYYFTQHYQYVYVLDYRKYFMRSLSDFVDYYNVDDVIFCFSAGQAQSAGGSGLINYFVR